MHEPPNEIGVGSVTDADNPGSDAEREGAHANQSPVDVLLAGMKTRAAERSRSEADVRARFSPLTRLQDALWACTTISSLIPDDRQQAPWLDQQAYLQSPEFAHRWVESWKRAAQAIRSFEIPGIPTIEGALTVEPRDGLAQELRERVVCIRDLFLGLVREGDAVAPRIERELARLIDQDRGSFSAHAWYFKAVAHELDWMRKRCELPSAERKSSDTPMRIRSTGRAPDQTDRLGPNITTNLDEPPAVRKHTLTIRMDFGTGVKPVHHKVHGKTQAQLAHMVMEMPDQDHDWEDLFAAGAARGAWGPIKIESLRRAGRLIEGELPPQLKGYWNQGMSGVRWQTS